MEHLVDANFASRRATEKILYTQRRNDKMSVKGLTKGYGHNQKNFFEREFLLQGGFL